MATLRSAFFCDSTTSMQFVNKILILLDILAFDASVIHGHGALEKLTMPKKTEDADFTQRVLMSLVVDMQAHVETVERMQAQIAALAKEHGVKMPTDG